MCTRSDTCVGGRCTGSDPVACPNPDCGPRLACNPESGQCEDALDASPIACGAPPCDGGSCADAASGGGEADSGPPPVEAGGAIDAGDARDAAMGPTGEPAGCSCRSAGSRQPIPSPATVIVLAGVVGCGAARRRRTVGRS
jgi:hypothetical protein